MCTQYQNSIQSKKGNSALNVANLLTTVLLTYISDIQKVASMPLPLTSSKPPLTASICNSGHLFGDI